MSHTHETGHGHAHGAARPASTRTRVAIIALLAPFALATVAGIVWLWPTARPQGHNQTGSEQIVHGVVVGAVPASCAGGASPPVGAQSATRTGQGGGAMTGAAGQVGTCAEVTVNLTGGPGAGGVIRQVESVGPGLPHYRQGDKVVLSYAAAAPAGVQYQILDFDRRLPMAVLGGVFALVVVAIGRWRGLAALATLGLSFLTLTLFMLPALLGGANPLALAVVSAAAIMLVALYLCHGVSVRTSIAVLGTLASLALIGALSAFFVVFADLTGLGSEETQYVGSLYTQVDVRGLLLAGVVIGALGVLFDVTVTQTSAVWELRGANPTLGARALYRAGMRIGRDHIASTVNTLVLAYAGASLPLLLLFYVAGHGLTDVTTSEVVAEEVVRTLIGSIGLVASVPLTTALAATVAARERPPRQASRPTRSRPPDDLWVERAPVGGGPRPGQRAGMAAPPPRSARPAGPPAPDAGNRGRHRR